MNYYPAYSPSIPLPQRLSMMEQQMQQQYPQYTQNQIPANYMPPYNTGGTNQQMPAVPQLQGEVVSDYETVKAMRTNLDGSISYYPSTDGQEIYTKSLNPDGTSNIKVYKLTAGESSGDKMMDLQETRDHLDRIESYFKTTNDRIDELFNVFLGTEPGSSSGKRGGGK